MLNSDKVLQGNRGRKKDFHWETSAEKIRVEVALELDFEGWREFHLLEVMIGKSATWGLFSAPLFPHLSHSIDQVLSLITHHCLCTRCLACTIAMTIASLLVFLYPRALSNSTWKSSMHMPVFPRGLGLFLSFS